MKTYTENELREIKNVFGEDVTFDKDGNPVEQGVGGPLQPRVFATKKAPGGVKPAELEFLRKMVAAVGNAELSRDFERYLAWRRAHPEQTTVEIPLEMLTSSPGHPGIDSEKLLQFRARLRGGDIPPPISVRKIADDRFRIEDGHCRTQAARDEGRRTVRAEIAKEFDPRKDRAKSFTEDREGM
jgi:hypothetical protein